MNPPRPRAGRRFWEWIKPILVVVVVFSTFRSAVADWNDVPTGSMKPTIVEGDRILVNKLAFGLRFPFTKRWITRWSTPARGEIVVLFSPADGARLVKRVVGQPGDTVQLRGNALHVNGERVEYGPPDAGAIAAIHPAERPSHTFASERLGWDWHAVMGTPGAPAQRDFGPVSIPPGFILVLGDNRDQSADSRVFGLVPVSRVVGRSSAVAFSLDRDNWWLPRWSRTLKHLD